MRKIDKSQILSKDYEKWLKNLDKENHPTYNSSANKHYHDIKMSLLYCQQGLCAYTEGLLCDSHFIMPEHWNKNSYQLKLKKEDKQSIKGDLEHFDESLKKNSGWLWDNLFVVDTHNNCRIKGKKPIKNILKPDSAEYDAFKYLSFDMETGVFTANIRLSSEEKEDVEYMIETLGLNCIPDRKKQLEEWLDRYNVGLPVEPYRYITAWEMTLANLKDT